MTPATIETVEQLDEMRYAAARKEADEFVSGADLKPVALRAIVRAIRQADERAGLVVVPREPTQAMSEAYERHCGWVLGLHSWDAAVSASPFASAAQGEGGE
jgi:hypothetical protein